jgi:hypothetical protein
VSKDDFGLSVEDVLALTDRELNQIVGLKKLAPYREEGRRCARAVGFWGGLRGGVWGALVGAICAAPRPHML